MSETTQRDMQPPTGPEANALWLDEPSSCWRVAAGVVNVFAVYVREGLADGRRWHLFEIKAGEPLRGLAPIACTGGSIRFPGLPGAGRQGEPLRRQQLE